MRRKAQWPILLLLVVMASCKQPGFYQTLGDAVTPVPLKIAPAALSLDVGKTATFTATGGDTPYSFALVSGPGTVDAATGAYSATAAGTTVVRVTDRKGITSDATVTVTAAPTPPPAVPLAIGPSSAAVNPTGTITFVATGGTPPYTFSSGTPWIPGSTITAAGFYSAGPTAGTDRVVVTDSEVPPVSVHADVTVTTATSNVNYTLSNVNLPANGVGGEAIPASLKFRISNIGSAGGTKPVSYWVYLSDSNVSPNSPDTILLDSNSSIASQVAGGSIDIALTGNWPLVPVVPLSGTTKYIWVQIAAMDDLNATDNLTNLQTVNVTPANVNYQPSAVTNTGGLKAGTALAGSFVLTNVGSDPGSQTVHWTAYVSTAAGDTIDGTSVVVDSGTHALLAAGAPSAVTITFGGTWPAAAVTPHYLKVKVTAADDTNPSDDSKASGAVATTWVDYTITPNFAPPASGLGGEPISGGYTFRIANNGTADGGQPMGFVVFLSDSSTNPNAPGTIVLQQNAPGALTAGSFVDVTLSGNWPLVPAAGATKYLWFQVTAADDLKATNNTYLTAMPVNLSPASVDYTATAVATPGPFLAGGSIAGSFTLQNTGLDPGTQTVHWTAYVGGTSGAVIDGSCVPVASGTHLPLAGTASAPGIPINGVWPATAGGPYYLKVQVSADDDTNAADNVGVSIAYNLTQVDYANATVTGVGGALFANNPFSVQFNYQNVGAANGAQPVAWTVYLSSTPALGAGSVKIATGIGPAQNAGNVSPIQLASGTWPTTPGPWYFIVNVRAPDDPVTADDDSPGALFTTGLPAIDYSINVPNITFATTSNSPGGPVNGDFSFQNTNLNYSGSQPVTWRAYASTSGAVDASATLIDSGSAGPLGATANSGPIPVSGMWPLQYGNYHLVVQISSPDDIVAGDNVLASVPFVVGVTDESTLEPNDDPSFGSTFPANLGVTLQPGMSYHVVGTLNTGDSGDVLQFNTGTTTSVAVYIVWAGSHDVTIYFMNAASSFVTSANTLAGTSLSLGWTHGVPGPGASRWIYVANTLNQNVGSYDLYLTGY